jgi:hypothetical protein
VNAQGIHIVLGMGQQTHSVKVGCLDGGNHTGGHASCTRTQVHSSTVGFELDGV